MKRSFLFSLLLFPILTYWITPPQPQVVHLAASGKMKEILTEISRYFEQRNPRTHVNLFLAESEVIARQIENHAALDVVVGDQEDIALLQSKSLLVDGTVQKFMVNPMVALAGPDVEWSITSAKEMTPENVKKIALQKETTKAGKTMREYLKKYGVLDALKDKTDEVKTPKAALDSVRKGDAKWTLAYSTDAVRRKNMKVLWRVPENDLPGLTISIAQLTSSGNPQMAAKLIEALQSSIVRKMFENAGYQLLTPPPDNRTPK